MAGRNCAASFARPRPTRAGDEEVSDLVAVYGTEACSQLACWNASQAVYGMSMSVIQLAQFANFCETFSLLARLIFVLPAS